MPNTSKSKKGGGKRSTRKHRPIKVVESRTPEAPASTPFDNLASVFRATLGAEPNLHPSGTPPQHANFGFSNAFMSHAYDQTKKVTRAPGHADSSMRSTVATAGTAPQMAYPREIPIFKGTLKIPQPVSQPPKANDVFSGLDKSIFGPAKLATEAEKATFDFGTAKPPHKTKKPRSAVFPNSLKKSDEETTTSAPHPPQDTAADTVSSSEPEGNPTAQQTAQPDSKLPQMSAERREFLLLRARSSFMSTDYSQAIASLTEYLEANPTDFDAALNRGVALEMTGNYRMSWEAYQKIAESPSLQADIARLRMCNILLRVGDFSKAAGVATEFMNTLGNFCVAPMLQTLKAGVTTVKKAEENLEKMLEKGEAYARDFDDDLLKLNGCYSTNYYNMWLRFQMQTLAKGINVRAETAIQHLPPCLGGTNDAIDYSAFISSDHAKLAILLAKYYWFQEKNDKALATLDAVMAVETPGEPMGNAALLLKNTIAEVDDHRKRGNDNFTAGDYAEARRCYEVALKKVGQNSAVKANLYANLGAVDLKQKLYEDAIARCRQAILCNKYHSKAMLRAALASMHLKKYAQAVQFYQNAIDALLTVGTTGCGKTETPLEDIRKMRAEAQKLLQGEAPPRCACGRCHDEDYDEEEEEEEDEYYDEDGYDHYHEGWGFQVPWETFHSTFTKNAPKPAAAPAPKPAAKPAPKPAAAPAPKPAPKPAPIPPKPKPNHYNTLKVPRTATQEEIKKAYRGLAKELHPDKGGDAEKFKAVNEAFSVLSDPVKRRDHDRGYN